MVWKDSGNKPTSDTNERSPPHKIMKNDNFA